MGQDPAFRRCALLGARWAAPLDAGLGTDFDERWGAPLGGGLVVAAAFPPADTVRPLGFALRPGAARNSAVRTAMNRDPLR